MNSGIRAIRWIGMAGAAALLLSLQACQFQPLYSGSGSTIAGGSHALASVSVADVGSRDAQQVRNHLIFLLSGGASPVSPSHEVRIRVSATDRVIAARVVSQTSSQIGNTAGNLELSASYEIYDLARKEVTHRGRRSATAAYDQTSQSFATERARRDAEGRAARELAEQLRLAVAADLSAN